MPRWTSEQLKRKQQRHPNLVPSGQVPDAKPQCDKAKPLGKAAEGETRGVGRVEGRIVLRYVLRRVNPLDCDNAAASTKDITDGLRRFRILPDDNPWIVSLTVEQEKVAHYEEEETLIYITYPLNASPSNVVSEDK